MEFFAAVPAALGRSLFQILADSGRFGLFILCITFVLSVMTWAVVWDRARFYSRLKSRGEALRKAMSNRGIAPCMADADRYLPAIEASILLEARRFVADRAVDGVPPTTIPPRPTTIAPGSRRCWKRARKTISAKWNDTSFCSPPPRAPRRSSVCSAPCGASCTAS
jgi:hypothetical protein